MRVVLEEVCEVSEVFLTVNISVEAVELVRDGPVVVLEFVCKVTEVFLEVLEAGANFIGSDKRTCAREDRLMAGKKELSLQFRYAQFGYVGDFSLFKKKRPYVCLTLFDRVIKCCVSITFCVY